MTRPPNNPRPENLSTNRRRGLPLYPIGGQDVAVATAFEATSDAMIPVIIACCLGASAMVGLVNGLLVTPQHASPCLATLAIMIVRQGLQDTRLEDAGRGPQRRAAISSA